ncbi:MAG: hypothetical protein Q8Q81_12275, partial [Oxalobacteraceae bacterium]|nr:hypothetical protein [Oxalobacteraceae bacterium]
PLIFSAMGGAAPVALRAPCAAPPIAISKDNYKTIKSDNKSSKTAYKGWGEGACNDEGGPKQGANLTALHMTRRPEDLLTPSPPAPLPRVGEGSNGVYAKILPLPHIFIASIKNTVFSIFYMALPQN